MVWASSFVAGQGVDDNGSLLWGNPVGFWIGDVGDHPVDVGKGKMGYIGRKNW